MEETVKKKTTLEFDRDQLLYDIKNLGYIIHDSSAQQTPEDGHNMVDVGEEGNVDRVTRVLDLAYADVCKFLMGYLPDLIEDEESDDDVFEETEKYYIYLELSTATPFKVIRILETYIHEYMVAKVMEDWCVMTGSDRYQYWAKKVEDLEVKIKGALSFRKGGIVIKQHPF